MQDAYIQFMKTIQDIYGNYPDKTREQKHSLFDYVIAYLKRDIDHTKLKRLVRYITYSHPVKYGPPDIAAIEKSIRDAMINKRGDGVHKTNLQNTHEDFDITPEELKEGKKLLESVGGLEGMFKRIISTKKQTLDKSAQSG